MEYMLMPVVEGPDTEWHDLEPAAPRPAAQPPLRFGLVKTRGAPARGSLLVRREVIDQLEMQNWRCRVRTGSGARAHQLALVPDLEGRFELTEMGTAKGGGTWRVLLPHIPRWPDIVLPTQERPWRIERDGRKKVLVVDLPPVLWDSRERERYLARLQKQQGQAA